MSVSSTQGSIYLQDEFSKYKELKRKSSHEKKRIIKPEYQGYILKAEQWKQSFCCLRKKKNG